MIVMPATCLYHLAFHPSIKFCASLLGVLLQTFVFRKWFDQVGSKFDIWIQHLGSFSFCVILARNCMILIIIIGFFFCLPSLVLVFIIFYYYFYCHIMYYGLGWNKLNNFSSEDVNIILMENTGAYTLAKAPEPYVHAMHVHAMQHQTSFFGVMG